MERHEKAQCECCNKTISRRNHEKHLEANPRCSAHYEQKELESNGFVRVGEDVCSFILEELGGCSIPGYFEARQLESLRKYQQYLESGKPPKISARVSKDFWVKGALAHIAELLSRTLSPGCELLLKSIPWKETELMKEVAIHLLAGKDAMPVTRHGVALSSALLTTKNMSCVCDMCGANIATLLEDSWFISDKTTILTSHAPPIEILLLCKDCDENPDVCLLSRLCPRIWAPSKKGLHWTYAWPFDDMITKDIFRGVYSLECARSLY